MRSPFDLIQEQIVRLRDQLAGVPRFERGRVTSVVPLRVQLDGDTSPLAGQPDSLVSGLRTNQYVQVMIYRHRATVIGAYGAMSDWQTPTLLNSWTGTLRYRVTPLGIQLIGRVAPANATHNTDRFAQLPTGARPSSDLSFRAASNLNRVNPRVTAEPDGSLRVPVAETGDLWWVDVSGIIIPID